MNFYTLSFSDLELLDDWKDNLPSLDYTAFLKILWTNGLDITRDFEIVVCTHRNLRKQVVTCNRVEGRERTDRQWFALGAYSTTAFIDSSEDWSLREYLNDISGANDNKKMTQIVENKIMEKG